MFPPPPEKASLAAPFLASRMVFVLRERNGGAREGGRSADLVCSRLKGRRITADKRKASTKICSSNLHTLIHTYLPPWCSIPLISPELSRAIVLMRPFYSSRLGVMPIFIPWLIRFRKVPPSPPLQGIAESRECSRMVRRSSLIVSLAYLTQSLEDIKACLIYREKHAIGLVFSLV